eukprot:TRINITY_DN6044_c0_g1_i6.p1 TRINITY_DN6044_c0_g1~~TRINITY_DN6044_c0_g1_i6.p1  ORF type:complete len:603 (+),score=63.42 TRINITY_DN6044_c0_g1_i6:302-2110(+)
MSTSKEIPDNILRLLHAGVLTDQSENNDNEQQQYNNRYYQILQRKTQRMNVETPTKVVRQVQQFKRMINHFRANSKPQFVKQGEVQLHSWMEVEGMEVPVPLTTDTIKEMKQKLKQGEFGLLGQGNTMDTSVRNCLETTNFEVSVNLDGILYDIRKKLAQTAEYIEARPYKLVVYPEGGFFKSHIDTVYETEQFATLSVNIPVWGDVEGGELVFENVRMDDVIEEDDEELMDGLRISDKEDEEEEEEELQQQTNDQDNTASDLGPMEIDEEVFSKEWIQRLKEVGRGVDSTDQDIQCASWDFNKEDTESPSCSWNEEYNTRYELQSQMQLYHDKRAAKYMAWLTDIEHEVRPVRQGTRVVVIYQLFRRGYMRLTGPSNCNRYIVNNVLERISEISEEEISSIGLITLHQYPPQGLQFDTLKTVDAQVYDYLSSAGLAMELVTTVEAAYGNYGRPYFYRGAQGVEGQGEPPFARWLRHVMVPLSCELQSAQYKKDDSQEVLEQFRFHLKSTLFFPLGSDLESMCLGGGVCYGNCDCGTDWYYQHSALIIPLEPFRRTNAIWNSIRTLVLIAKRQEQQDGWISKIYNEHQMIYRKICSFLLKPN